MPVGLITRRSEVQILPPLTIFSKNQRSHLWPTKPQKCPLKKTPDPNSPQKRFFYPSNTAHAPNHPFDRPPICSQQLATAKTAKASQISTKKHPLLPVKSPNTGNQARLQHLANATFQKKAKNTQLGGPTNVKSQFSDATPTKKRQKMPSTAPADTGKTKKQQEKVITGNDYDYKSLR